MGNTFEKPQQPTIEDAPAEDSVVAETEQDNTSMDVSDVEEEEWWSTSSMGSGPTIHHGVAVAANVDCADNNNLPVVTVPENNHGVLALHEAAAAAAKQEREAACIPKPFRAWLKPQQPVWLDVLNGVSDTINDLDETAGAPDEDDDPSSSCVGGSSYWNNSPGSNTRNNGNDTRSGMLLWTAKKPNFGTTSFSSVCSRTTASSSSSSTTWFTDELEYNNQELALSAVEPTEASDLTRPRHVWIVTTASLPWMTGTAVNPLLRAASLWQRYRDSTDVASAEDTKSSFSITLVLPWLCREKDRMALYGEDWKDKTVQGQEAYIRSWICDRAKLPEASKNICIQWYSAHYHPALSSIFAVDDVCDACLNVPDNAVVVLEEPEHLNFYRVPGKASWKQRFRHVIGIVHTNYRAYAQSHASGLVTGPLIGALVSSLVRAYCDKVIKLSDALQNYALEKQVTSNVHGIRQEFLQVGAPTGNKVYFIGKLLWAKGLDRMLTLQSHYKKATGSYFTMDIYGSGPEQEEIARAFLGKKRRRKIRQSSDASAGSRDDESSEENKSDGVVSTPGKMPVQFLGRVDHAALSTDYKTFVNPSITEVLCTTTAEALAMGKFVLIPHHPSNTFFSQFPNCLQYHSRYEFCVLMKYALTHDPTPLFDTLRHTLTWDAATDRFFKASAVSIRDAARRERIAGASDERFANFHEDVCKGTSGAFVRSILHGDDPLKKGQQEQQQSSAGQVDIMTNHGFSSSWIPKHTAVTA